MRSPLTFKTIGREKYREDRWIDRWMDRQMDRQMDGQIDGYIDSQIDKVQCDQIGRFIESSWQQIILTKVSNILGVFWDILKTLFLSKNIFGHFWAIKWLLVNLKSFHTDQVHMNLLCKWPKQDKIKEEMDQRQRQRWQSERRTNRCSKYDDKSITIVQCEGKLHATLQ